MRVFLSLVIFMVLCTAGRGQDNINSEELSRRDSLRKVMEERMARYRRQQEIYEKMFAESPKRAMDYIVQYEKHKYSADGLRRLKALIENKRIDTLKKIDLTYAGLDEVPPEVFRATNLEVLVLDYNNIKKLPKELGSLPDLKSIYWRSNSLDDFWWIRIQQLENIEKLDLSYNTLTRVPLGIKKLSSLKELVLDENLFEEVPVNRLSRADFVEEVSFNNSPNLEITERNYGKIDFIKVFKVNKCDLTYLHSSIYEMDGVEEVQLQENKLDSLPEGISNWKNLTRLSFYKNDLRSLPDDFFHLKKLRVVDLYFNELEVIPDALGELKSLQILYLASNKIYDVPESIGNLTNLEQLYLHRNRLSAIPTSIGELKKLKVFRVNENYLIDFPGQVLELPNLEDLDISDNQIASIPKGIENLEHLKLFTYQQNPIDFNAAENRYLSPMIIRMMDSGTICIPRINKEEVSELTKGTSE